jgi:hypothetical protein
MPLACLSIGCNTAARLNRAGRRCCGSIWRHGAAVIAALETRIVVLEAGHPGVPGVHVTAFRLAGYCLTIELSDGSEVNVDHCRRWSSSNVSATPARWRVQDRNNQFSRAAFKANVQRAFHQGISFAEVIPDRIG